MRYLYDQKLWDKIEVMVEWLIFIGLMIAATLRFSSNLMEASFYIMLGTIIAPLSRIERRTKRYLLIGGFFLGRLAGYFS
ncbi:hypothetical protein [Nostoc sp. UIC 10630]|uniref:hypothetical protein n=1 Tax=Nostoc sp. UIC 10630 TaxID=2100146 RepID=UPI0013D55BEF|nr:hypothetical protein [Nostoc sp. UIC 10630]NEU83112.1 hypothetical protein [Nostoc sp. UIC 10630]